VTAPPSASETGETARLRLAYRGVMDRVSTLAEGLDGPAADRTVPATPGWRVRDLLAHLVGVPADVLGGRLDGVATDAWTAAQVDARRDRSVPDLLAEWESTWPGFAAVLESLGQANPTPAKQAVFDAVTHEHDLRGALDQAGARGGDAWDIAWEFGAWALGATRDGDGAGALCLHAWDGEPVTVGTGDVVVTVRASSFDLFRMISGRRSPAQIRAFSWDGEPRPEQLCVFPPRATDLVE
jgi:uncharacterized protein (TIGR03083 family)